MFDLEGADAGRGGSWQLAELVIASGSSLSKCGVVLTAGELLQEAKTIGDRAGTLSFSWDGNIIEISGSKGCATVSLNGGNPHKVKDPGNLRLKLSQNACCVGESCLMWPSKPLSSVVAVDSHVHLCPPSFSEGNRWVQGEARFVVKEWNESDLLEDAAKGLVRE